MPSVLMLGLDRYLLRACARRGVDPVVVCSHSVWDKGAVDVPDGVRVLRVDDQSAPDPVLAALHRAGLHRFDAVVTTDEWALVTASVLAPLLGGRAIDPVAAVHLRDKSLQKDRVRAAGIPVARTAVIDDLHAVGDGPLPFERAVLKPIAGAATRNTWVVTNGADLRQRAREHRAAHGGQRTYLLEEFVPGAEWIADGIVFGGEVLFFALGSYVQPCLTLVLERQPVTMHRLDPETDARCYAAAEPVVRGALAAIGHTDGVFHLELFHDEATGRTVFSECAGRRGGALTHEEVQHKFAVDLGDATLCCALGRRPELAVKVDPRAVGGAFLHGRPGILISHPTLAEILAQPDVVFARLHATYGTRLADAVTTTNERLAELLITGESPEHIQARADELRAWFDRSSVVAPVPATPRELRRWQAGTWAAAAVPDVTYGD